MKNIFTLILTIFICINVYSQNQWNQIHPYPTLNDLFAVHFNSEQEGWISGGGSAGGFVFYTNDAGETWETQVTSENTAYRSLFFIDENEGWAGGWKCIYHTTNKGNTWEVYNVPDVLSTSFDIFFINDSVGWAVGDLNSILKTTDGGQTWNVKQYDLFSIVQYYGVCFYDELHGFAVGCGDYHEIYDGILMMTNDGGETWKDITPEDCHYLTAITFSDTTTGWICGHGGVGGAGAEFYKTIDGGETWVKQTTDYYTNYLDIQFTSQDTGMILDKFKGFFVTTDGGITWDLKLSLSDYLLKLSLVNNNDCYSVGYAGRIVKSNNLGNTWEYVSRQTMEGYLSNIGFFDSYNGFCTGFHDGTSLYKTIDGGYNWIRDTILDKTNFYLCRVYGSTAYLVSNDNIAKSIDGGINWELFSTPQNDYWYKDMQFVNDNTGFLCGYYGVLKKTIDGGLTWEDKSMANDKSFSEFQWLDENYGWLVDNSNAVLLKTLDGGESWDDSGLNNVSSVFFLNADIGFVTTNDSKLLKTVDAGNSWDEICDFTNGAGFVRFIDELTGWHFSGPNVHYTYDGGKTWQDQQYFKNGSIKSVFILDENQAWLSGENGFVATCDFTVGNSCIISNKSTINSYPNPGTDQLTIKTENKESYLVLFDVNGQVVANKTIADGLVNINTSYLPSGIYFYRLTNTETGTYESGKWVKK